MTKQKRAIHLAIIFISLAFLIALVLFGPAQRPTEVIQIEVTHTHEGGTE